MCTPSNFQSLFNDNSKKRISKNGLKLSRPSQRDVSELITTLAPISDTSRQFELFIVNLGSTDFALDFGRLPPHTIGHHIIVLLFVHKRTSINKIQKLL